MRDIDDLVIKAQSDNSILEEFIECNEVYILKCASKTTHRYISKSDDEWSIALMAFHQAILDYSINKGSFYAFSDLVIKRRLYDYLRGQRRFSQEVSVDPVVFETDSEEATEDVSIKIAVAEQVSQSDSGDIKLEIEAVNQQFSLYGFSFFDLTSCSPKAKKTKESCAKAVNYILQNPIMITNMQDTKQLPLKIIEKNVGIPRKILDRHRKYIIAAVEILSGEYPKLSEYLRYIREVMI